MRTSSLQHDRKERRGHCTTPRAPRWRAAGVLALKTAARTERRLLLKRAPLAAPLRRARGQSTKRIGQAASPQIIVQRTTKCTNHRPPHNALHTPSYGSLCRRSRPGRETAATRGLPDRSRRRCAGIVALLVTVEDSALDALIISPSALGHPIFEFLNPRAWSDA